MTAMNISFRTLKGDKFKLEAAPEETVTDLKKKVVTRYDDKEFNAYRLIYKGKVLDNAKTLAESGVTEAGFIVVMPPKRAAPPKPTAAAPASKPAAKSTASPAAAPGLGQSTAATSETPAVSATAPTAAPSAPTTSSAGGSSSALVTGAELEATVKRICEMGFPESEVKRALRAAFNNPERAVDYLANGIPASAAPPAPPSTPPQGAPTRTQGGAEAPANTATRAPAPGQPFDMFGNAGGQGTPGGTGGARGTPGNLDFLRQGAPIHNMRRMIQSNPAVLHQILQQLEHSDPHLLQLINNNREEFMNLINQPEGGEGGQTDDATMEQLASQFGGTGVNAQGQLMVTEEEHQVITRLTELGASMGLEQQHVIQAWLACEKDENLAANYLLNNSDELRAQQAEDAAYAEAEARNRGQGGGGGGQPPPPTGGS